MNLIHRTPAPPRHLMDAMTTAHNNPAELRRLHALYVAWLNDQGHLTDGTRVPDRAWGDQ